MKTVIQRVKQASVSIENKEHGTIQQGYMILVGIGETDTEDTVEKMAEKISKLRIFEDENGKMNLSILQINGSILSISQFTLYADCSSGNRPSFSKAGQPAMAQSLYMYFNECLRQKGIRVAEGVFGADMEVGLINDGPVTIILNSKELGYDSTVR